MKFEKDYNDSHELIQGWFFINILIVIWNSRKKKKKKEKKQMQTPRRGVLYAGWLCPMIAS